MQDRHPCILTGASSSVSAKSGSNLGLERSNELKISEVMKPAPLITSNDFFFLEIIHKNQDYKERNSSQFDKRREGTEFSIKRYKLYKVSAWFDISCEKSDKTLPWLVSMNIHAISINLFRFSWGESTADFGERAVTDSIFGNMQVEIISACESYLNLLSVMISVNWLITSIWTEIRRVVQTEKVTRSGRGMILSSGSPELTCNSTIATCEGWKKGRV